MGKNWALISMACAAAILAGCGESPPSDKDVQAAVGKQIDQTMGKGTAESQREELARIRVAKCAKAELGGFSCEYEAPTGGKARGRFVKQADGWVLAGAGG